MELKGIDVSAYQGDIDWNEAAKHIGFAIIRAGYGKNNVDAKAHRNIKGCIENNVPFGLYWFSYALNVCMAIKEADFICDIADMYSPELPICYDWEYDSDAYAKRHSVYPSTDMRATMAKAFCNRVLERGYTPAVYANHDYLLKGLDRPAQIYDLWLAQWASMATIDCAIWQSSCEAHVPGINGPVDLDVMYKDYLCKGKATEHKDEVLEYITKNHGERYIKIADSILQGNFENGEERKRKLEERGIDYKIAQGIVNFLYEGGYIGN